VAAGNRQGLVVFSLRWNFTKERKRREFDFALGLGFVQTWTSTKAVEGPLSNKY